jgi:hypothetical protein
VTDTNGAMAPKANPAAPADHPIGATAGGARALQAGDPDL